MALGFASALTAAGFEVAHGIVEIGYDDAAVNAGLARTEAETHRGASAISKTILGVGAAAALGFGLAAKAALDAETETARFDQAVKTAGLDVAQATEHLKKNQAAGTALGFTNIEILHSYGSLIAATHDYTKANNLLALAQDLARFKGMSLADASKDVIRVMAGNTRALKEFGIIVPSQSKDSDRLAASYRLVTQAIRERFAAMAQGRGYGLTQAEKNQESAALANAAASKKQEAAQARVNDMAAKGRVALGLLTEKVRGQASAFKDTAAGAFDVFKARLVAIGENVGAKVLPVLVTLVTILGSLLSLLTAHTMVVKILVGVLGAALGVWLAWKIALMANTVWQKAVWFWTNRNADAVVLLRARLAANAIATDADTAAKATNTAALETNEMATITWVEGQNGAMVAVTAETEAITTQTAALAANTEAKLANGGAGATGGVGGFMSGRFTLGRLGMAGMFATGGIIAGQVAGSLGAPKPVNRALTGAGIGAGIGMFFPEFGGPITGTAIGAAVGALTTLFHATPTFEDQIKSASLDMKSLAESTRIATGNIIQIRSNIAGMTLSRDQLVRQIHADRVAVRGAPGSKIAHDQLAADIAQLRALDVQIKQAHRDEQAQNAVRLANGAKQLQNYDNMIYATQMLGTQQSLMNDALGHSDDMIRKYGAHTWEYMTKNQRATALWREDIEKLAASSDPKLKKVYDRLLEISHTINGIPNPKRVKLEFDVAFNMPDLSKTPFGRFMADPSTANLLDLWGLNKKPGDTTGGINGPKARPPVKGLSAEQQIQIALAGNPSDQAAMVAQIAHDRATLAYLKRRRDAGKMSNADYVQAVQQVDADLQSMETSLKSARHKAVGIAGALPLRLQLAEAEAATTMNNADDLRVARAEKHWIESEISRVKAEKISKKQKQEELIALYNDLATVQSKLQAAANAQAQAVLDALNLRQTWLGEFASNIYSRNHGGLEFGASGSDTGTHHHTHHHTHHKKVEVNQENHHHGDTSQFQTMRDARFAAEAVL